MVNAQARIAVSLDQTGRLSRSGRQDVLLGLRKRLCRQGVLVGLRFVGYLIKGSNVTGEWFVRLYVRDLCMLN